MNNIFIYYLFSQVDKAIIDQLLIVFTTFITLFSCTQTKAINAQTLSKNNTEIIFYGNKKEAIVMGGEYIVFQNNNHVAKGLVYVQNYDVFSCFQGTYDRQNESFEELTFAYPELGADEWVETESEDKISLKDFPHQLNELDINENTRQLFNQCVSFFQNN